MYLKNSPDVFLELCIYISVHYLESIEIFNFNIDKFANSWIIWAVKQNKNKEKVLDNYALRYAFTVTNRTMMRRPVHMQPKKKDNRFVINFQSEKHKHQ